MNETCRKLDLTLHLTHLKGYIIEMMNRLNETKLDPKFIYLTNHDAVLTICKEYYGLDNAVLGKNFETIDEIFNVEVFDTHL